MSEDYDYELVIIGAGVIGLACAATGSQAAESTLVIERHESFGFESSSRNSEIIHAGIYYPEYSLKAKLCVRGNESLYEWCKVHKVPFKRTGKYIISTNADEEGSLEKIFSQGKKNGARDLSLVSKDKLQKSEPNVKGTMAIYSPTSGIVDSHELMKSLKRVAANNGCDFGWRHDIVGIERISKGYKLFVDDPSNNRLSITAKRVINAAGLDSDTLASLLGIDIDKHGYMLQYIRGSYFRIGAGKENLVNHLIYPVPPADSNNLGIHLTPDLNGGLRIGPDSEILDKREQDYRVNDSLKEKFLESVSRYISGLSLEDIHPDMSGIRSSLKRDRSGFNDFIIAEESGKGFDNWINLIGIDSPGLTCCLEIAAVCMEYLGIDKDK